MVKIDFRIYVSWKLTHFIACLKKHFIYMLENIVPKIIFFPQEDNISSMLCSALVRVTVSHLSDTSYGQPPHRSQTWLSVSILWNGFGQ
jgi:hypothetical protein